MDDSRGPHGGLTAVVDSEPSPSPSPSPSPQAAAAKKAKAAEQKQRTVCPIPSPYTIPVILPLALVADLPCLASGSASSAWLMCPRLLPCHAATLGLCSECRANPLTRDLVAVGLKCSVCQTRIEKEIAVDGPAFGAPCCKTEGVFKSRSCTHAANAVVMPCGHSLRHLLHACHIQQDLYPICRAQGRT